MKTTKSILIVSRDKVLQNTRRLVLENAGYCVSSAHSDAEAIQFVEGPDSYSLVLLCHSVPETSRLFLVDTLKTLQPTLPILMLYNSYDPTMAKVDASMHSQESPVVLLEIIGRLTQIARSAGAH
jgi:CheY-like chemotaxis protein